MEGSFYFDEHNAIAQYLVKINLAHLKPEDELADFATYTSQGRGNVKSMSRDFLNACLVNSRSILRPWKPKLSGWSCLPER